MSVVYIAVTMFFRLVNLQFVQDVKEEIQKRKCICVTVYVFCLEHDIAYAMFTRIYNMLLYSLLYSSNFMSHRIV